MAPPHVPEISLHLADEAHDLWQRTEEELAEIGLPPPFWAFAWAGGQGLARYVLDHPEIVRGKRVLDFASGSGLVAHRRGEGRRGRACSPPTSIRSATTAVGLNAAANGVDGRLHRPPTDRHAMTAGTSCWPATSSTTSLR